MECKDFGIGLAPYRASDTEHCSIQMDEQDSELVGTRYCLI